MARAKALSPRGLWGWEGSRAQGKHHCLLGWGSPATSPALATTNRDSGKLPAGAPGPRPAPIAVVGMSPLPSCGRETRGTPAIGAPARGLGGTAVWRRVVESSTVVRGLRATQGELALRAQRDLGR